jgi:hypothetical protein
VTVSRTRQTNSEPTSAASATILSGAYSSSEGQAYYADVLTITATPPSTAGYIYNLSGLTCRLYDTIAGTSRGSAVSVTNGGTFTINNTSYNYNRVDITASYLRTVKKIPYYITGSGSISSVGTSTSSATDSWNASGTSYSYFSSVYGYLKCPTSSYPWPTGGSYYTMQLYKYVSSNPVSYYYWRTISPVSKPSGDSINFGSFTSRATQTSILSGSQYLTNKVQKSFTISTSFSNCVFYIYRISVPSAQYSTIKSNMPTFFLGWSSGESIEVPLYSNSGSGSQVGSITISCWGGYSYGSNTLEVTVTLPSSISATGSITLQSCQLYPIA